MLSNLHDKLKLFSHKLCHKLALFCLAAVYYLVFPLILLTALLFDKKRLQNPVNRKAQSFWLDIENEEEDLNRQF